MKTVSFTTLLIFLSFSVHYAAVLTVSNSSIGGAQYSSLSAAYTAASPGDTLLLEGTDIPYSPPDWDKKLTVIGIGFNPDKQIPKKTKISYSYIYYSYYYFRIYSGGTGSRFYGIEFTHWIQPDQSCDSLLFEDCKINEYFHFNNQQADDIVFRNCVFPRNNDANVYLGSGNRNQSVVFSGCVFNGYIHGQNNTYADILIEHCLFLSTTTDNFSQVYYAQIQNSIFANRFPQGTYHSDYLNNLCAVAGSFPPLPGNGNTGTGNIENTDPNFVNYTSGELYSTTHDYDLQAGSAAIGAAINGTDIGVHGGYSNFSETGEVLITPIVRTMTILNGSVVPNGTLQVDVRATAPHDH